MVFKKPYAGWKDMFGALIPAHKVKGQNFNNTWANSIDIASGPFMFDRWQKGSQLVLKRNPNYPGTKSKLNQIVFRFIPDTNTQFQAMRGGEVDMIAPQPQLQIADIKKQAGIRVQSGPEFAWEHLDFQLGAKWPSGPAPAVRPPGDRDRHQPRPDRDGAVQARSLRAFRS